MKTKDYYQTLDLNKNATAKEIKRAYRQLAFKYHPDRNPLDEKAEEMFKQISKAYAVLGDDEKRRVYDKYGYAEFRKHYSSENISDFMSGCGRTMRGNFFFGKGMGCRKHRI